MKNLNRGWTSIVLGILGAGRSAMIAIKLARLPLKTEISPCVQSATRTIGIKAVKLWTTQERKAVCMAQSQMRVVGHQFVVSCAEQEYHDIRLTTRMKSCA